MVMPAAKKQTIKSFSKQSAFATNKMIQNLGSNVEQYKFSGNLRNVHGRD